MVPKPASSRALNRPRISPGLVLRGSGLGAKMGDKILDVGKAAQKLRVQVPADTDELIAGKNLAGLARALAAKGPLIAEKDARRSAEGAGELQAATLSARQVSGGDVHPIAEAEISRDVVHARFTAFAAFTVTPPCTPPCRMKSSRCTASGASYVTGQRLYQS